MDAIRENEGVIARMQERIALVRVEGRGSAASVGLSSRARREAEAAAAAAAAATEDEDDDQRSGERRSCAATADQQVRNPWTDGTFQTGVIGMGQVQRWTPPLDQGKGGSLTDEELRRRMEEQLRDLGDEDDEEGGMHL